MSKEVTNTGEMWVEKTQTGNMKLGFTQSFLDRYQSECWHIIPQQGKLQKGMVLLSLETNDGLVPVKSPYDGDVVSFATEAINFPEKLTEAKEIVVIKVQDQRPLSAKDYRRPTAKATKAGGRSRSGTTTEVIIDDFQFGPPNPMQIQEQILQQQNRRILEQMQREGQRIQEAQRRRLEPAPDAVGQITWGTWLPGE